MNNYKCCKIIKINTKLVFRKFWIKFKIKRWKNILTLIKIKIMETPKDQLIEMYYRRIQAMEFKINQLQTQLNQI